jgi:hypothetical protein
MCNVSALLITDMLLGCMTICISSQFMQTMNNDHVARNTELMTIRHRKLTAKDKMEYVGDFDLCAELKHVQSLPAKARVIIAYTRIHILTHT